jgi:nitrate/nitrite transport system ATP-binding protein
MAFLQVRGLTKSYVTPRGATRVLGGVDLAVEEGEFVAILGYSGSGKTTLISLLAGLIAPDAGSIMLDGTPVAGPGPDRGIVFQHYALLPWMTAHENVALAVDAVNPGRSAAERRRMTDELLALVGLAAASAMTAVGLVITPLPPGTRLSEAPAPPGPARRPPRPRAGPPPRSRQRARPAAGR